MTSVSIDARDLRATLEIKQLGPTDGLEVQRWLENLVYFIDSQWGQLLKWERKEDEEREQGRNFRHSTLNLSNLRRLRHSSRICKEDFS